MEAAGANFYSSKGILQLGQVQDVPLAELQFDEREFAGSDSVGVGTEKSRVRCDDELGVDEIRHLRVGREDGPTRTAGATLIVSDPDCTEKSLVLLVLNFHQDWLGHRLPAEELTMDADHLQRPVLLVLDSVLELVGHTAYTSPAHSYVRARLTYACAHIMAGINKTYGIHFTEDRRNRDKPKLSWRSFDCRLRTG